MVTALRRFAGPALLALGIARGPAHAASPCFARFADLCGRLRSDPRVILRTDEGSVFLPNPARSGAEIVNHPPLARAIAGGPDRENLGRKVKFVFSTLTTLLEAKLAALPEDHPTRRALWRKVKAVKLKTRDTARCRGQDRPYWAAFSRGDVVMCPWMSHLSAEALFTAFAHELGHLVDPCDGARGRQAPFPTLPPFPAERAGDCAGDGELFADKVGALLSEEVLGMQRLAGGGLLEYPSAPHDRAGAFLFYALHLDDCRGVSPADGRLAAFFDRPGLQGFLGCRR